MKNKNLATSLMLILVLSFFALMGCNQDKDVTAGEKNAGSKNSDIKKSNNPMVVSVNGIELTEDVLDADINRKLEPMKAQFPQDRIEQIKSQMRDKFIDNFIIRTVISQEAKKKKVLVSEKEINSKIAEIEKSLPAGITMEKALLMNGMTVESMRKEIKFGLTSNKLFDTEIKNDTTPSEEKINKYFNDNRKQFDTPETVHARHILVRTTDSDNETSKKEKKAKIESIRKQLLEGGDFAVIAKDNSDCPSKAKGGDLGTFSRGSMVKPFEEASFSQKEKEIGPVIKTKFGYHVIQVLEHNKAQSKSLNDARDTIVERLKQQENQKAITQYVAQLKDKAKIVYGSDYKKPAN